MNSYKKKVFQPLPSQSVLFLKKYVCVCMFSNCMIYVIAIPLWIQFSFFVKYFTALQKANSRCRNYCACIFTSFSCCADGIGLLRLQSQYPFRHTKTWRFYFVTSYIIKTKLYLFIKVVMKNYHWKMKNEAEKLKLQKEMDWTLFC